jgi:hypothetical protein
LSAGGHPLTQVVMQWSCGVFSVIRHVSVPFGITTADEPNIPSMRWRSVADHKRRLHFFEYGRTVAFGYSLALYCRIGEWRAKP